MPHPVFTPILVTNAGSGGLLGEGALRDQILRAHAKARQAFGEGLVSPLSGPGPGGEQQFCVFGNLTRDPHAQWQHGNAVDQYVDWLGSTELEFIALRSDFRTAPEIAHSQWANENLDARA